MQYISLSAFTEHGFFAITSPIVYKSIRLTRLGRTNREYDTYNNPRFVESSITIKRLYTPSVMYPRVGE